MRRTMAGTGLVAVMALGGCGDGGSVEISEIESGIQRDYQRQITQQARELDLGEVVVRSVECVRRGDDAARCFAELDGATTVRQGIDVTIDGEEFLWEAEADPLATLVPDEPAAPEEVAPPDGELDPLALLEAAGPAGDEFEDAALEGDALVLFLAGDPADVNTDEIADACDALREAAGAGSVEVEDPFGERTPVC